VGGKYIYKEQDFCFYQMFKTKFSGQNNIWREPKNVREEMPPVATGLECVSRMAILRLIL